MYTVISFYSYCTYISSKSKDNARKSDQTVLKMWKFVQDFSNYKIVLRAPELVVQDALSDKKSRVVERVLVVSILVQVVQGAPIMRVKAFRAAIGSEPI